MGDGRLCTQCCPGKRKLPALTALKCSFVLRPAATRGRAWKREGRSRVLALRTSNPCSIVGSTKNRGPWDKEVLGAPSTEHRAPSTQYPVPRTTNNQTMHGIMMYREAIHVSGLLQVRFAKRVLNAISKSHITCMTVLRWIYNAQDSLIRFVRFCSYTLNGSLNLSILFCLSRTTKALC